MPITCPKCGSDQITAQKKGFNAAAALGGDMMLGPLGLMAGAGGQHKIVITCLNCGKAWKPGDIQRMERRKLAAQNGTSSMARILDFLLFVGIVIAPYIFAWFTLRKKYSMPVKVLAFGWLAFMIFVGIRYS